MSLLGHGLLCGLGLLFDVIRADEGSASQPPQLAAHAAVPALPAAVAVMEQARRVDRERRALVEEARADLRAGRLSLGRFLLRAGGIDAEEMGQPFEAGEVEALYEARVSALREALGDSDVVSAVPLVFGDLRYRGEPGGLMAMALLEGGGSCEQVAQLVAAAVYDAGRAGEIGLRYYGGPMEDGIVHLAPVAVLKGAGAGSGKREAGAEAGAGSGKRGAGAEAGAGAGARGGAGEGEEHDLMSGRVAVPGGVRIPAAELVEVYARAHGLAPRLEGIAGRAIG